MKAHNNKPLTAILLKCNSEYLFFLREFSSCKIAKHKESQRARVSEDWPAGDWPAYQNYPQCRRSAKYPRLR